MTQEGSWARPVVVPGQACSLQHRQIRAAYRVRREAEPFQVKPVIPCCREKPLASFERPVPQTDTGGQVENTEAIGRTVVKELGKLPP